MEGMQGSRYSGWLMNSLSYQGVTKSSGKGIESLSLCSEIRMKSPMLPHRNCASSLGTGLPAGFR